MGQITPEERIDQAKITYRARLELMEEKKWTKKVFDWRKYIKFVKETSNKMRKETKMKINEMQGQKEILIDGKIIKGEKKIGNRIEN